MPIVGLSAARMHAGTGALGSAAVRPDGWAGGTRLSVGSEIDDALCSWMDLN